MIEQVFSEKPDFKLSQHNRLSENANEWQEQVLQFLHEKVPQKMGLQVKVVMQQQNAETGYAVGSVALREPRTGRTINVPVIVRAFHLAPLDVAIDSKGKAQPFTADTVKEMFFSPDLFTGTVPGGRKPDDVFYDDSLYNQTFPPIYGKYTYSSDYRVLNAISGTLGGADIAAFKKLAADPLVKRAAAKAGQKDVIDGLANETAAAEKGFQRFGKNVFVVRRTGASRYRLLGNSDQVFDPIVVDCDRGEMADFIRRLFGSSTAAMSERVSETLHELERNGEKTIKIERPDTTAEDPTSRQGKTKQPFLFNPLADSKTVKELSEFGHYGVRDNAGIFVRGTLLPNVIDFDGKKTGLKIFASKALASLQHRFAGVPLEGTNAQPTGSARLPYGDPAPGKTGTFVSETKEAVVATLPIAIRAVTESAGVRTVRGVTSHGEPITLVIAPGLQAIGKQGKDYYLPTQFRFVELGNLKHVSESKEDFTKQAADSLLGNGMRVLCFHGAYSFRSPELAKYASGDRERFEFISPQEAKLYLCSWGCAPETAEDILKEAHQLIDARVHGLAFTPSAAELREPLAKRASVEQGIIAELKATGQRLLKLASGLKDSDTVDKALALNFVNPVNVERFTSAIPQYKEVVSSLAKLLLASRMGMEDVPEESVLLGMNEMQKVINGLEKLRALAQAQ